MKIKSVLFLFLLSISACLTKAQDALYHAPINLKPGNDSLLLDEVQKQTLRYFTDFAHPISGMARERSNIAYEYGNEVVTTGGTGFGIMALVSGVKRGWIQRDSALNHIIKLVKFLEKANHYHGIFPHWLHGETGKTIPFSRKDDGGDIVESAYLFTGLLSARAFFDQQNPKETELRNRITWLWEAAEWNWYTQNQNVLYWHWSPNHGWSMNFAIHGWNECLIAYVLAAASPRYAIQPEVYHQGWATGSYFKNGKSYYDIPLQLGFPYGGPLFFSHYSFLGLNPHGLKDQYADYWLQNLNHTRINFSHCVKNPNGFKNYGKNCWGLTASDNHEGYNAHAPDNDLGVISPTAALSAFPYTPKESMDALKYFYFQRGKDIWGQYGFVDAFNDSKNWVASSYLAIDQGPIVVMIENYRSGLLWNLFMQDKDIQNGLKKLGFESPYIKK